MVAENMIQAALTSSARAWLLSKLGCGPAGCGPSPPVLRSSSPLHWRARWIRARTSTQAHSDRSAPHIDGRDDDGLRPRSRPAERPGRSAGKMKRGGCQRSPKTPNRSDGATGGNKGCFHW